MAVLVSDVRSLMGLDALNNEQIEAHLVRANMDFEGLDFKSEAHEKEAVGCRCIYYLHPLLWVRIAQHLEEYEEQFQTMSEAKEFGNYWWQRSVSATPSKDGSGTDGLGRVGDNLYTAI